MANFYEKLDEAFMYGINKGVKFLNRRTGVSKTTLANSLNIVAPFFESYGMVGANVPGAGFIGLFAFTATGITLWRNFRQESVEDKTTDKNAKADLKYERVNECCGLITGVGAVGIGAPTGSENDGSLIYSGIGSGIRALSHYIMRADPTPPARVKDGASSGSDGFLKLLERYKLRETVNVPVVG
jgi:hypothetical protein